MSEKISDKEKNLSPHHMREMLNSRSDNERSKERKRGKQEKIYGLPKN